MAFKVIAAEFRILSGSDRKVGKWCDHLSGSEKKVRNWDLHLGEPPLIDYHLDNRLRPHETALRHVKAYKVSMKPSTPEYTYLPAIKFRSHVWASKKSGIKICLSTLWWEIRYTNFLWLWYGWKIDNTPAGDFWHFQCDLLKVTLHWALKMFLVLWLKGQFRSNRDFNNIATSPLRHIARFPDCEIASSVLTRF